ncbi:helix-hairpin-helix domain-containing protein [Thermoanaerobacterium thermosaccharolyticum]|uniref:helix-hairpin-helix domain-containing protein n=1 Tax=Thermoanaerobacterium thermosaccharolyticum TaxID=1517 RepID=UPI00177E45F9|nr:helix-hairpin-helix domain-containing protein [Thermoanaerobacterium thermosaccharolyticum]MBE0069567.1 transporter [Thermoanaerobacterium thermosaccharolyticum]MBE0229248.1 transporter [Thermoanaerobacterium thermosaccharolyticum]MCP2239749.1 competence protein ComEA [Thermoanaerobacterium thermosaccharolyticum]
MFKLTKNQQYGIIILLAVVLFTTGYFIFEKNKNNDSNIDMSLKSTDSVLNAGNTNEIVSNEKPKEIKVYVTGLVKSPGVYTMKDGDRIDDAIKLAGGALEGADLSNINLAEKVKDEQMIKISKVGEDNSSTGGIGDVKKADGKININKATKEELDTLPGIGEITAQRIIDFREQHGNFQKIEDIMNVSRIGPKLFEQIKDKITVD